MKKGRVTALPLYSLHLHSPMNPTTVELLRAATIQALQNKQDVAAVELLSLMDLGNAPQIKALPQAAEKVIVDGPAHDYHYWSKFIRQNFIPFMTSNGRLRFTSHELLTWLENRQDVVLTAGDMDKNTKDNFVWRHCVSAALGTLKSQGVLKAPPFGKEYEIREASPQLKQAEACQALEQAFDDYLNDPA